MLTRLPQFAGFLVAAALIAGQVDTLVAAPRGRFSFSGNSRTPRTAPKVQVQNNSGNSQQMKKGTTQTGNTTVGRTVTQGTKFNAGTTTTRGRITGGKFDSPTTTLQENKTGGVVSGRGKVSRGVNLTGQIGAKLPGQSTTTTGNSAIDAVLAKKRTSGNSKGITLPGLSGQKAAKKPESNGQASDSPFGPLPTPGEGDGGQMTTQGFFDEAADFVGDFVEDPVGTTTETAEDAAGAVGDAIETGAEVIGDVTETAEDALEEVIAEGSAELEEGVEAVREGIAEGGRVAGEAIEQAVETKQQADEWLIDRTGKVIDETRGQVEEGAEWIGEQTQEAGKIVEEQTGRLEDARDDAAEWIGEQTEQAGKVVEEQIERGREAHEQAIEQIDDLLHGEPGYEYRPSEDLDEGRVEHLPPRDDDDPRGTPNPRDEEDRNDAPTPHEGDTGNYDEGDGYADAPVDEMPEDDNEYDEYPDQNEEQYDEYDNHVSVGELINLVVELRDTVGGLPIGGSTGGGGYVDASPAVEAPAPVVEEAAAETPELSLVEVRLADPGNAELGIGPCYRVTVRNNSTVAAGGFEVALLAGIDFEQVEEIAEVRERVEKLYGGLIRTIDLRLPAEAFSLRRDNEGGDVPYRLLLLAIDPAGEVGEQKVENNRGLFDRSEIKPVDLRLFGADRRVAMAGESLTLLGEGLGPKPGQVVLVVDGRRFSLSVESWSTTRIVVRLPGVRGTSRVSAQIVVIGESQVESSPALLLIEPRTAQFAADGSRP